MSDHKTEQDAPSPSSEELAEVTFHYVKSPQYRTMSVEGAWGSVSPTGAITMSVYSERLPIPKRITHTVSDGGLADEVGRESREGVIREVEATMTMTLKTAIAMRAWLDERINHLADRIGVDVEDLLEKGESE